MLKHITYLFIAITYFFYEQIGHSSHMILGILYLITFIMSLVTEEKEEFMY